MNRIDILKIKRRYSEKVFKMFFPLVYRAYLRMMSTPEEPEIPEEPGESGE